MGIPCCTSKRGWTPAGLAVGEVENWGRRKHMKTWDLFAGKHGDLIGILVGIIIKNINDVQFFPKMGVRLGLDLERHQNWCWCFQDPRSQIQPVHNFRSVGCGRVEGEEVPTSVAFAWKTMVMRLPLIPTLWQSNMASWEIPYKLEVLMRTSSANGGFSVAMFVYQGVMMLSLNRCAFRPSMGSSLCVLVLQSIFSGSQGFENWMRFTGKLEWPKINNRAHPARTCCGSYLVAITFIRQGHVSHDASRDPFEVSLRRWRVSEENQIQFKEPLHWWSKVGGSSTFTDGSFHI